LNSAIRLISATNRDLEKEVEKGNFREDLFYRINTIAVNTPALVTAPPRRIPLTPQQKQTLEELRQFAECGLPYTDMTLQEVKDWFEQFKELSKSDETDDPDCATTTPQVAAS